MEVTELISKSGRRKQDILTDFNDYCVLKKRSNTLGSILKDHDIQRMNDLHPAFLLYKSIIHKQKKIQSAHKAADASAATAALSNVINTSSNVVNTSISSTAAAANSSTSYSTTANKIRGSIDYTPQSSVSPLHYVLRPMTLPELVLVSILCRTSHLFLQRIP